MYLEKIAVRQDKRQEDFTRFFPKVPWKNFKYRRVVSPKERSTVDRYIEKNYLLEI